MNCMNLTKDSAGVRENATVAQEEVVGWSESSRIKLGESRLTKRVWGSNWMGWLRIWGDQVFEEWCAPVVLFGYIRVKK